MTQRIDILLEGAANGDAITAQAIQQQGWLRARNVDCTIYAVHLDPTAADRVEPFDTFRLTPQTTSLIYHHSIDSSIVDKLADYALPVTMVYHNITPQRFFSTMDAAWAEKMSIGRQQLTQLVPLVTLPLAVSPVNRAELQSVGFQNSAVLPLSVSTNRLAGDINPQLADRLAQHALNLLFVGRFVPNKRQEDLVKLLVHVQRIRPNTHLHLVGDPWQIQYDRWVELLAGDLGVGAHVHMPGKVPLADLRTYYRHCDLYVSMSEHEGVGKPLLECMACDLPIVAYDEPGVRGTLADAGVLFREKRYAELAELVVLLHDSAELRQRIISRQRQRLAHFTVDNVQHTFYAQLAAHGLLPSVKI